jgi:murein DD-endopeptidase MepM/ murein hydrolase activator NlpD
LSRNCGGLKKSRPRISDDQDKLGIGPLRDLFQTCCLPACCLIALIFALPAAAQDAAPDMKSPRVSSANVDWNAVRTALADVDVLTSHGDTPPPDMLTRLNVATTKILPKISVSPVPVLLPLDTASLLRDDAQGTAGDASKYLSGFHAATFFFPGPSGYDAALALRPRDAPDLALSFAKPVDVQISGSALVYQLDGPQVSDGEPVPQLDGQFPGIRRTLLESHLRYTFVRFDVPYVVSIQCFDGPGGARRLSCREADKVALRFLKALNVAGGSLQTGDANLTPHTIARPDQVSPDFTYYAPGDILPGTGMRGQSGRADFTVYAKIRFPMAQAPAYANSQSFMNWGNCDLTGRVGLGGSGDNAAYHCRVNGKRLVTDESKNYIYPWRDNFCEHRSYGVGQCPTGLGHQGQDIRPGNCLQRVEGAGRCDPYQQDVVAVSDGVLLRAPGDKALYLIVDNPGEHIRFRYLHMNPDMLDAAGMVSGRSVSAGEVLGSVGNYGRQAGGTTTHLHFDAQVPTRAGWVFVNPYMTLVAAYERLVGGRGQVVNDAMFAPAPATVESQTPASGDEPDRQSAPNSAAITTLKLAEAPKSSASDDIVTSNIGESSPHPSPQANSELNIVTAEHCTTHFVKGHRRHVCRSDAAATRTRGRHAVRSVGHHVSHEGDNAWHYGGDVRPRHARTASRHHRA